MAKKQNDEDPVVEVNFTERGRPIITVQLDRTWLRELCTNEGSKNLSVTAVLNTMPITVSVRVYKRKALPSVSASVKE